MDGPEAGDQENQRPQVDTTRAGELVSCGGEADRWSPWGGWPGGRTVLDAPEADGAALSGTEQTVSVTLENSSEHVHMKAVEAGLPRVLGRRWQQRRKLS